MNTPEAPAVPDVAEGSKLGTVADVAAFLRKSPRWVFLALRQPEGTPGSIPHVRLGRTPRLIPDDLRAWAASGFPPVATFRAWQETERRRQRKN
jgi:hypothetical protein